MNAVLLATLWMGGALISFISMAIAGRELSAELNTFQILFFRSAIGLIIIVGLLSWAGWSQIKTNKLGLHFIRNLAHYVGQFGWFFAISLIPLAHVFAIEFTVPIWMAIFAPLLLGERLTPMRLFVILIGFVGVLIVLRPGMIPIEIGVISALIAALGYALAHTLTKKLTITDTPLSVLFYMTLIQLPMGAIPSLMDWVTPSASMAPWILIVAATALSAHYCMARAFAHADAVVVVPMDFLRLPLVAFLGMFLYGEPLDFWVLAGAGIIFIGIFANVVNEHRRAH